MHLRHLHTKTTKVIILCAISGLCFLLVRNISWTQNVIGNDYIRKKAIKSLQAGIDIYEIGINSSFVNSCDGHEIPFLLCIVHSSPTHFLYRSTVRKTWGSMTKAFGKTIKLIFVVGLTSSKVQTKLQYEMKTYSDIIQGNFTDTYRNLTLKHLIGYRWATENCHNVTLILKTDDDVFLDIFRAITLVVNTFGSKPSNLLACLIIPSGSNPKFSGKWAVTKEEFYDDFYPEYCSGMLYFVSPDIVSKILEQSKYQPFFWIDDIFVTGQIAEMCNIRKSDISVWFARNEYQYLEWMTSNSTRPCPWLVTECSPKCWPEDITKLWLKTVRTWKTYMHH